MSTSTKGSRRKPAFTTQLVNSALALVNRFKRSSFQPCEGRSSAAFQVQREEDTSIPMIKKGWAPKRCFPVRARGRRTLAPDRSWNVPARRAGGRPLLGLPEILSMRSAPLVAIIVPILPAGCASAIESQFTVFADPGKYEWYSCEQLGPQRQL